MGRLLNGSDYGLVGGQGRTPEDLDRSARVLGLLGWGMGFVLAVYLGWCFLRLVGVVS